MKGRPKSSIKGAPASNVGTTTTFGSGSSGPRTAAKSSDNRAVSGPRPAATLVAAVWMGNESCAVLIIRVRLLPI